MAGLLGNAARTVGLLGLPVSRGATPEAMRRHGEEQRRAEMLAAQRRPPRGEPGFLTYFLGGRNALNAERERYEADRARLEEEAMRPQVEAQRAEILASITDPRERALFLASPDDWAKNVGQQFAPQVIAAGGVQSVIGNGQRVAAPSFAEFGQDMVRRDPITGAVETVATRGPTFAEETARINANNPVSVAPGGVLVDPRTGETVAQGAPRVFSASDGAQLYDEAGRRIAENVRDVDPATAARTAERTEARQRAIESERQQIASVRETIGRARQQISGWTTGPLAGLAAIGGTPAADLAATLDTIEANLSFRALAEMRANSPTGGALGSITERELQLLGSTVANLRQSQSPSQLRENLSIIERTLSEIERRSAQQAPASGGISREAAIAEARRRGLIR